MRSDVEAANGELYSNGRKSRWMCRILALTPRKGGVSLSSVTGTPSRDHSQRLSLLLPYGQQSVSELDMTADGKLRLRICR